jgi:shikimate dehydrogenase
VNCVVRRDDDLVGENTDGQGFLIALETITAAAGQHVVIFGAGGAARAIAVELALAGASSITIVNRDRAHGTELVRLLDDKTGAGATFASWDQRPYQLPQHTNIVVNATSIGLYPNIGARLNLDTDTLATHMIVADVIPNPPRTRLIRDAEDRGCTVLDGRGMLVNQAIIGIKHWTGIDADPSVMRRTLETVLTKAEQAAVHESLVENLRGDRQLDVGSREIEQAGMSSEIPRQRPSLDEPQFVPATRIPARESP